MSGVSWTRKNHLASTRTPAILERLRLEARRDSISKLQKLCTDLNGHFSNFGCEREVAHSIANRWGGRIGFEAYQTEVTVSAICSTDDSNLNWTEEQWYSMLFPIREACPSHKVIPMEGHP